MYPPDGQDSQVAVYIDKLLEEMKIAYNKELASREAIHQQREKEHIEYQEALQIHVNELSTQLASVTAALEEVVAP
jgi:hypothetical protein